MNENIRVNNAIAKMYVVEENDNASPILSSLAVIVKYRLLSSPSCIFVVATVVN